MLNLFRFPIRHIAGSVLLAGAIFNANSGFAGDAVLALENSPIVNKSTDHGLCVLNKDGSPFTGVKLSQYDADVQTPSLAITSDGILHLAFIERQAASPYAYFVYYRESADGGQTWSEPKNLSEDMPNINVSHCSLVSDGQYRVYVIWRTGLAEYFQPSDGAVVNLVYRVLDHGKWSKIILMHPPGDSKAQSVGSIFSFAGTDSDGHAQVVWNACPNTYHTNLLANGWMAVAGIGNGLVFQETLDGKTPPTPKEIYMTKVMINPNDPVYGKSCNELSALDGYFDAAGAPHFIAISLAAASSEPSSQVDLIENGKETPAIKLPSEHMVTWLTPPKLLVDAQGHRHVIAFYRAGEHPNIRDYVIGSDDDPSVILNPKGPKGTCMGFQAYQGPSGHMIAIMQMTDEGFVDNGDTFISMSDGGPWSPPICVTANAARATWVAKNKGRLLTVATGDHYGPGAGAVAFDKTGHLLLALINVKTGSFGLAAGGVTYASGSSASPMLFFYRF